MAIDRDPGPRTSVRSEAEHRRREAGRDRESRSERLVNWITTRIRDDE